MKILDNEIDFSFSNGDNLEKFENAIEIAKNKIDKVNQNQKGSTIIKEIYAIVSECVDNIFGVNYSQKLFEGKVELKTCIKVFKDLVNAKNEQENSLNEEIQELQSSLEIANSRYSPERARR